MYYKAYRFRIYPDEKQRTLINKTLGCIRFVYNYFLNIQKENSYKKASENIKYYTHHLKYEYPFLQEADSIAINKALFNLEDSYKRFFNKQSGYPKFKSKFSKNSYSTTAIYGTYKNNNYCNIELDLENKIIKLPKLKKTKIRGYRNTKSINGRIISATVSREPNGKYYVSVLFEMNDEIQNVVPASIVGIDLGVKKLVTLSDGTEYENNKYILKYEKRIKRMQRALSRKVKGSNNYFKCKRKLVTLHNKLANSRKCYIHKISKNITDEYDIITCEKLHTKSMIIEGKKNTLSKNINDACFNEIIRQLEYKSKFKGKQFYQIYDYYPSSQTCSRCNNQDKKYKNLNERIYNCTKCYLKLDRDLNASINIMFEGLKMYIKNNKRNILKSNISMIK